MGVEHAMGSDDGPTRHLGNAWVALTVSLAIHVADEAAHDFLAVYNPAVRAIREQLPYAPFPIFTFPVWIGGLIAAVTILLALSPLAYRQAKGIRRFSWFYGIAMLLNGLGHFAGSLYLGEPMAGVYSSPLLLVSSVYLLRSLMRLPTQR